jgi:hypothetical protein
MAVEQARALIRQFLTPGPPPNASLVRSALDRVLPSHPSPCRAWPRQFGDGRLGGALRRLARRRGDMLKEIGDRSPASRITARSVPGEACAIFTGGVDAGGADTVVMQDARTDGETAGASPRRRAKAGQTTALRPARM